MIVGGGKREPKKISHCVCACVGDGGGGGGGYKKGDLSKRQLFSELSSSFKI